MPRLFHAIREHLGRRAAYGRLRDWMTSLYNRALLRGWALPGRGREVAVRLAGREQPFHLRLGTSDWHVLEEIFFDGEYAIADEFARDSIRTIVDLGANVGYSVLLWKTRFPEARVIAVEPDANNMAVAKRNAEALPGVTLIEGCATARSGHVTLDRSGGEAWAFRVGAPPKTGSTGADAIRAYSMDDLLQAAAVPNDAPIDLLKCDIEGGEAELFADCRSWIGRVRHVIIELHRPYRSEQFFADLARGGATVEEQRVQDFGSHEVIYVRLAAGS